MKNKGLFGLFVGCIIVIGAVVSIYYYEPGEEPITTQIRLADDSNATAESVSSLVDSLNDFSFSFYQQIAESEEGNIFFSPYSVFVALSMAYEGAKGHTATEMQNILHILQNDSATLGSFGRIYNLLNQNQEGYTISTANAFWAHENYEFLQKYLSLLENYYMAEANELDFSKNVEAAEIINNWIEEHTNGKIKDIVPSNALSELTRLVLTNAIYFKGLWENPFDPEDTFETDFEVNSSETVKVNMMSCTKYTFNHTETEDLQILELPYKGNDLSMMIVLPKENDISIAESSLNTENLTIWRNDLTELSIDVYLPKFKFETQYNLNNILQEMGMLDAFSLGIADFSGMDGTMNLFISKVLHKAFVEVNEEGTEAAAATVIIMPTGVISDQFRADHPFIFLIQHKETGAILFTGKVMNPAD